MSKKQQKTTLDSKQVLLIDQSDDRLSVLSRALIEFEFSIWLKQQYDTLLRYVDDFHPDVIILVSMNQVMNFKEYSLVTTKFSTSGGHFC